MGEYNGIMTLHEDVARHSERIRELDEDVLAVRKTLAAQDDAIERIDRKLDKLLIQKRIVISLVVGAVGILGAGIPTAVWMMNAQMRNMLMDLHVVEMHRIP